jgi:hypothetical protein
VIAGGSGFEEVTVVVTEIDVDGAQAEAGFGKQMDAQLRWLAGPLRLPLRMSYMAIRPVR